MISAAPYKKPRLTIKRKRLSILALFLLSLAGCLGESNTAPPTLPPGVTNISKTTAVSLAPSAASIGSVIYVVWGEGIDAVNDEIFLARSDNGGMSFGTPINVSKSPDFSGNPKIALSNNGTSNIVHVVWEELISNPGSGELEFDIFYSRAVEGLTGSLTFESPQNLSASLPVCGPSQASVFPCPSQVPAITTFNNHVFVAWMESTFYTQPNASDPSSTFQLFNSDILMVKSSDHGINFNKANPEVLSLPSISFSGTQSPSQNPSLAATGGHLFIAWEDTPPPDVTIPKILFRSLEIASSVYTPPITSPGLPLSDQIDLVGKPVIANSNLPGIAAEGDNVYLIWEGTDPDPNESDSEIFLRQAGNVSSGSPFIFSTARNLSNNTGRSKKGRIAISGQDIFIAWEDASTGPLVLFSNSIDGGVTFGNTQTLISSSSTIGNTAITASNNTLFTFWEDALFGNFEVFSSRQ